MKKSFVLILILFYGCGTTDSDSKTDEPITQGILMTDEPGLQIGEWRSPSPPTPQSDSFLLVAPYPNPSSSIIQITFETEIVTPRQVDIWVLPVRLPEDNESHYVKEFGPESVADGRIITLVNELFSAGHHNIFWEPNLPEGFYRIYAETNVETLWHDIFIGSPGESYQDMIDYLNNLNN